MSTQDPKADGLPAGNPAWRLVPVGLAVFVVVSAAILAAMLSLQLLQSSRVGYGEIRGAPSLALLSGTPIFQGRKVLGPLFCVPYAPLFYPLYSPIGLWKRPESVLLAGSVLAFAFYSLPLWYLMLHFRREPRRTAAGAAAMPLLFVAFTLCSAPLTYSGTQLHADGPALGFAGLAGCILYFHHASRRWTGPLLCALMSVLAVGSKQSLILVLLAVPVLCVSLGRRTFAARYLVGLVAFGLAVALAVTIFYGGASNIVFNIWTLPKPGRASFERIRVLVALNVLHGESLPLLYTAAAMALAAVALRLRLSRDDLRRMAILPGFALLLLPASFFFMTLAGADQNALSPPIYFALLSILVLVYDSTVNALPIGRIWVAACLITAGLLVPVTLREVRPPFLKQALGPGPSEVAFEYARRHPGEVYFPLHQLSVYLAEGRFYHADWGVGAYGGPALRREDIFAYIPPAARYVAYPFNPPGQFALSYLAPSRKRHPIAELPEFDVFEIER